MKRSFQSAILVIIFGLIASCSILDNIKVNPEKQNASVSDSPTTMENPLPIDSNAESKTNANTPPIEQRSNQVGSQESTVGKHEFSRAPTTLAFGVKHSCEIIDRKVYCWGVANKTTLPPKELDGVEQIVAGKDFTCSLNDQSKIHCWGENSSIPENPLVNKPLRLWADDGTLCAQSPEGMSCFGKVKIQAPNNIHATDAAIGSSHVCAISNQSIHCWGDNNFKQLQSPNFTNPSQIVANKNDTCALYSEGVRCWGEGKVKVKPFVGSVFGSDEVEAFPTQISFMWHSICGLVNGSLQCPNGNLEFPGVNVKKDLLNIYSYNESNVICVQNLNQTKCNSYIEDAYFSFSRPKFKWTQDLVFSQGWYRTKTDKGIFLFKFTYATAPQFADYTKFSSSINGITQPKDNKLGFVAHLGGSVGTHCWIYSRNRISSVICTDSDQFTNEYEVEGTLGAEKIWATVEGFLIQSKSGYTLIKRHARIAVPATGPLNGISDYSWAYDRDITSCFIKNGQVSCSVSYTGGVDYSLLEFNFDEPRSVKAGDKSIYVLDKQGLYYWDFLREKKPQLIMKNVIALSQGGDACVITTSSLECRNSIRVPFVP